MSTGLSRYSREIVEEQTDAIRAGFYRLLSDETFDHAITYATNSVPQVRDRFAMSKAMLEGVLGACPA